MSLIEGATGLSASDIALLSGKGKGNGDNDGFGGNSAFLILILVLFAAMCGGGFGNRSGGNGGGSGASDIVPYMMASSAANTIGNNDVQRGFDQQSIMAGLGGITSAISTGFANAEISRCNSQTNLLQALWNNQLGLYQTLNQNQSATTQGMNNLAMSLQNCCCENRAATADLKYTVATEACADRQAVNDGIRDVITNATANTQAIINSQTAGFQGIQNKLCQLELDEARRERDDERRENLRLQTELSNARLGESQTAQTSQIISNLTAQLQALTNMLLPRCNCNNQNTCGCQG